MSQLLLAFDPSVKTGSLALARASVEGLREIDVLEVVPLAGGAFSAQLVPQMAALLEKHGCNKRDLGALIVASGPGSFTGLRVGLAAVKALAEVSQKPIVAVSVLEAVACSGAGRGRVLALLDAGRGDVYAGGYQLDSQAGPNSGARVRMDSERLLSWEEFIAEANSPDAQLKVIVTPEAALAEKVRAAGIEVELIAYPNSGVIARLGWEHLQRGDTVRPEELEANYLRRSDAEIFSKPVR
ncbi:MAG: tRNA (adenosine(37)-N6)-threonylcarbamoyltransferase complex dimerization subunit type 1 TsaB [Terriglobales bacterium]